MGPSLRSKRAKGKTTMPFLMWIRARENHRLRKPTGKLQCSGIQINTLKEQKKSRRMQKPSLRISEKLMPFFPIRKSARCTTKELTSKRSTKEAWEVVCRAVWIQATSSKCLWEAEWVEWAAWVVVAEDLEVVEHSSTLEVCETLNIEINQRFHLHCARKPTNYIHKI